MRVKDLQDSGLIHPPRLPKSIDARKVADALDALGIPSEAFKSMRMTHASIDLTLFAVDTTGSVLFTEEGENVTINVILPLISPE